MTTSGVTITEMNLASIGAAAMRKITLAKGQVPDIEDTANYTEALNNLVAELMTMGMPLWALKTAVVPMTAGVQDYVIGVGKPINLTMPTRIMQAWSEQIVGGSRQELNPTADQDFNRLPLNSGSIGVPSQYNYLPNINYGTLRIWPAPNATTASSRTLSIRYLADFDQFVNSTDTPYFPRVFNSTLIYGVAVALAPEFGVPLNDRGMLEKEYQSHLEIAMDSTTENASFYFQPDTRYYNWR